jgi:hypothetical protein
VATFGAGRGPVGAAAAVAGVPGPRLAGSGSIGEDEPFVPGTGGGVMGGSLLFVHGTGVKDVAPTLQRLREGLGPLVGIPKERVVGVQWGMMDAPPTLEVAPALPPAATKGIDDGTPPGEGTEEGIWELLLTDPLVELRLLGTRDSDDDGLDVAVGVEPMDEQLQSRLDELSVNTDLLAKAEITESRLAEAAQEVGGSDELGEAAIAAGDAGYEELLDATARSVVACLLSECGDLPPDKLPRLCTDAAVRDELVTAVLDDLQPGLPKGFASRAAKAVLLPLATRAAVRKRADYMVGTTNFLRDVAFYVRRGEKIRNRVRMDLAELTQDEPVVLLGHSLGGIAAVDLLSNKQDERVDLLVTVGSQAPLLYLMDALEHLRPGSSKVKPFTPWLNIYDRNDLLSFCAERVWPNTTGIEDHEVASRISFPTSHSAYWSQEALYTILAERWPKP